MSPDWQSFYLLLALHPTAEKEPLRRADVDPLGTSMLNMAPPSANLAMRTCEYPSQAW